MALTIGKIRTDNFAGSFINDYLGFEGMSFLFAGIEFALFYLGRSIGVSVASMSIISNS